MQQSLFRAVYAFALALLHMLHVVALHASRDSRLFAAGVRISLLISTYLRLSNSITGVNDVEFICINEITH